MLMSSACHYQPLQKNPAALQRAATCKNDGREMKLLISQLGLPERSAFVAPHTCGRSLGEMCSYIFFFFFFLSNKMCAHSPNPNVMSTESHFIFEPFPKIPLRTPPRFAFCFPERPLGLSGNRIVRWWRWVFPLFWVNYNDVTRPHPKWWLMCGIAPPTTLFQVGEVLF